VAAGPDRVVVLYSHPLLGEGLGRMLAAEPDLVVTTVNLGTIEALDEALAGKPDVVVFEEGGPIGVLDVLRRSGATVVIDVDITSSTAWTLRRQALRSAPEEVLGAIRDALAGRTAPSGPVGTAAEPTQFARPVTAVGPGRRRARVAAAES
jgi:DNA-binding NarL/FixJ family response regulator